VPITTEVDHKERLIRFKVSGKLVTDEMLAAIDEAFRLVGDEKGYDILSDHRELETPADPSQIEAVIGRMSDREQQFAGSRAAVIVAQKASYGMMRMLAARVDPLGIKVGVFWNLEDALHFLDKKTPAP